MPEGSDTEAFKRETIEHRKDIEFLQDDRKNIWRIIEGFRDTFDNLKNEINKVRIQMALTHGAISITTTVVTAWVVYRITKGTP